MSLNNTNDTYKLQKTKLESAINQVFKLNTGGNNDGTFN